MRAPLHLWIVGVVTLLWNGGGAFDYLMSQIGNEAYLSNLSDVQRAFLENAPKWFDAAWATGVWGSILGSLLLLLKSRFASTAFVASAIAMVVSAVYSFFIASPSTIEMNGAFALLFSGLILVGILAQYAYARRMTARGVLG